MLDKISCDAPYFNFDRFPADWRDRIESALGGLAFLGSPVWKLLWLKSVDDRHCYQKCIS